MCQATEIQAPFRSRLADTKIIEGWMRGTYIVAGVFAITAERVSISALRGNIPELYAATKSARRSRLPRGIVGTYIFPFYLGSDFPPDVVEWVQRKQPYRWAIWHEPVLYDINNNSVWMRADHGHFGSAFHPLVFELYARAFAVIAERLQRPQPDFINGKPV